MTTYRISFPAIVTRLVDAPNELDWSEAYTFAKDRVGWYEIAHSAAAEITIDTTKTLEFGSVPKTGES